MKPGMSNLTLLNDLRRGHQVATRLLLIISVSKEDLAERISDQLMFGKENLLRLLNDSVYCDSFRFYPETIHALSFLIPMRFIGIYPRINLYVA